jgi:hypothetical protein
MNVKHIVKIEKGKTKKKQIQKRIGIIHHTKRHGNIFIKVDLWGAAKESEDVYDIGNRIIKMLEQKKYKVLSDKDYFGGRWR